jgi:hypothetical protein
MFMRFSPSRAETILKIDLCKLAGENRAANKIKPQRGEMSIAKDHLQKKSSEGAKQ